MRRAEHSVRSARDTYTTQRSQGIRRAAQNIIPSSDHEQVATSDPVVQPAWGDYAFSEEQSRMLNRRPVSFTDYVLTSYGATKGLQSIASNRGDLADLVLPGATTGVIGEALHYLRYRPGGFRF